MDHLSHLLLVSRNGLKNLDGGSEFRRRRIYGLQPHARTAAKHVIVEPQRVGQLLFRLQPHPVGKAREALSLEVCGHRKVEIRRGQLSLDLIVEGSQDFFSHQHASFVGRSPVPPGGGRWRDASKDNPSRIPLRREKANAPDPGRPRRGRRRKEEQWRHDCDNQPPRGASRNGANPGTRVRRAHLPSRVGEVHRNGGVTTQYWSPLLPAAGDLAPPLPKRCLAGFLASPPVESHAHSSPGGGEQVDPNAPSPRRAQVLSFDATSLRIYFVFTRVFPSARPSKPSVGPSVLEEPSVRENVAIHPPGLA